MAARLLVMFSVMILEAGLGVAGILGTIGSYHGRQPDEGGIAGIVMICCGTAMSWLITMAIFVRKSSREKARRIIADAQAKAAQVLAEATDRSLALCSLDGGRCEQCGNPRTGRFCPKCGKAGAGATASAPSNAAGQVGMAVVSSAAVRAVVHA
jgi:hypothetical protein